MNAQTNFSALDRQFGDFLQNLAEESAPEVRLAAMCASRARAEGNVCVTVREIAEIEGAPNIASLRKKLRDSSVVGEPGAFTPLILDRHGRLYLRRYWEYEQQLAQAITNRTSASPSKGKKETDLQEAAARKAVRSDFTVITGGPGTGKTWTVKRILTLLLEQPGGENLRIALAAPTGKAAARLTESVRAVRETFAATTIHRLLGYLPGSPYFRHDADHQLNADVVIVDEASMVDLALMAKLLGAVPNDARLILLGDRDQLASVEAGSVLADICAAAEEAVSNEPLHGAVVGLRRNYRFAETGEIYRVSSAINSGNAEAAIAVLQEGAGGEVEWQPLPNANKPGDALRERIVAGFRPCLETDDPLEALARLQKFRILCAVRQGPFGVENLNAVTEEILARAGLLVPRRGCYGGQPIMVTQNDYNLALFNGDSGIVLPDPDADGDLRAFFLSAEGNLRRFLPSRLPRHETAFAITVHKSQGSEFAKVLLILPEKDSPVLTRELLYTGLTRARERVELWASESTLRAAIGRRVSRTSGLRDALAGSVRRPPGRAEEGG
ncbi:MAG TPA: exodeoxyribonuclease V subunit alpha [Chthoniobacterales bacterium]|jgi:exodeoxyribonuclease V alpha subunit|nr:exodeoxyribonuclease V subunit alpha [Chthoniobacterales bacterium]